MRAKFTVTEGNDRGAVFYLEDGQTATVGRSSRCEVLLHDVGVSRAHCQLTHTAGRASVADLNSTNGTFVNSRRAHDAQLSAQDTINIGHSTITFGGVESGAPGPQAALDEAGSSAEPDDVQGRQASEKPPEPASSPLSVPFRLDESTLEVEAVQDEDGAEDAYRMAFAQTMREPAGPRAPDPGPSPGGEVKEAESQGGQAAESGDDMALDLDDLPAAPAQDKPAPCAQEQGPALGAEIGDCQLVESLEHNDVCLVFKGLQPAIGREVGLHLLRAQIAADALERERFLSAARGAARIDHRHLLRVYDAGETEAWVYMVTEHIEGITAAAIMDRWGRVGEFDEPQAAQILRRVAKALRALHEQGLVHLNVRPENVFITPRGVVKLVNLSLVRPIPQGPADAVTTTQILCHDLHYRSPEEVTESATVDHRADVYSLGATLFAMVTGHAPFETVSRSDLAGEVRHGDVGTPTRFNPRVPQPLCDIIAKAMAKEPGERFQTAQDVQTALDQALQTV